MPAKSQQPRSLRPGRPLSGSIDHLATLSPSIIISIYILSTSVISLTQQPLHSVRMFDGSDWTLDNNGSNIYLQGPTSRLNLREFYLLPESSKNFRSAIEKTIAVQFSLGSISIEWNHRFQLQSSARFLVECDDDQYSLDHITPTPGRKWKLSVFRNTLDYARFKSTHFSWSAKSELDIEFSFELWKTADGKQVRLIAASERTISPIIEHLLLSNGPIKVKIGSGRVGFASIQAGRYRLDASRCDAIEVSFGVETLTVPINQITLFEPPFHLSPRQNSFNDFLNQNPCKLLTFPANSEEDLIKVLENSRYKALLTLDQLHSGDDIFSDTSSNDSQWIDDIENRGVISDAVLSEVDRRAFVILVTHPTRADMMLIVQLVQMALTVALLLDEPNVPWLPDGLVVWDNSMELITEADG
ncbi:uncharacterized protein PAC_14780 [Phialocephala subalpina]|uniref:Uncharacterized protein n=1 Tax=Phialocephala subalpina TaxID=576137 RepID=A0A1L7XIL4_9HELO|nr:uncharacterized protein PAC_14780 [Phialocephala subalpina]